MTLSASKVFILIAVILAVLAAFGIALGPVTLLPLAVAFGFGSFLVP